MKKNFFCFKTKMLGKDFKEGCEFNVKYGHTRFVKLTNKDENHHGFVFKTGLNEDPTFNYKFGNSKNGITFTTIDRMGQWIKYNDKVGLMVYARMVEIPDDAKIVDNDGSSHINEPLHKDENNILVNNYGVPKRRRSDDSFFKVNKLILGEKISIWDTPELYNEILKQNPSAKEYVNWKKK